MRRRRRWKHRSNSELAGFLRVAAAALEGGEEEEQFKWMTMIPAAAARRASFPGQ